MLLAGERSLRDVIAFPKTARALDLMSGSPSPVSSQQLRELHLRIEED
jgi:aspartyl-tRNA synthetase